jgi:hypothetical protein
MLNDPTRGLWTVVRVTREKALDGGRVQAASRQ